MPTADRPASTPNGRRPAPITPDELASVRTETIAASPLPARVYHNSEVLAWEQAQWFAASWFCVGREEDPPHAGSFFRTAIADEPLTEVRGNDGQIRAFYNVCRHRGSLVVEEDADRLVRFQCPDHAWIDGLDGTLHIPRFTESGIDVDPADAVGFWDLTNRPDWHGCELQQGTGNRSFDGGRYSAFEAGPHLFAARVADRSAADGRETAVTPIAKRDQKARHGTTRAAGGAE